VVLTALTVAVAAGSPARAQPSAVSGVAVPDSGARSLYAESHALLVGVSDYTAGWPDLESVPRELEQVQAVLEAQGFRVVKRLNLTGEALKREFEAFIDAHGYHPKNRLLFFFAGHGHTWDEAGHGYLVPADAPVPATEKADPGPEFLRKALHMSQILAWSRQMTARHVLFLFDSCFSGTIFKARALPTRPPHISEATLLPVREFITAGSAGEQVPAASVFAPALVDALRFRWGDLNADGYITGVELGLYLQTKVPAHGQQTPQFGKHPDYHLARGDFLFEVKGQEPAAAPVAPTAAGSPPPPPPPVLLLGNVQVNVNVPATVTVNGEVVGEAAPGRPLNRQNVPAGRVEVRVVGRGHRPASQVVEVRGGQWEQLVFQLTPAPVAVPPAEPAVPAAPTPTPPRQAAPAAAPKPPRETPKEVTRETPAGAPRTRIEASPAPAPAESCTRACEERAARCRADAPAVDPALCRQKAETECRAVSQQCRRSMGVLGGTLSVDAECTGQQVQCERRVRASCEEQRDEAPALCDRERGACLEACRR
jgi:hypothetical protein